MIATGDAMNSAHLAGVAHDLRNDLTIIQAASAALRRLWPPEASEMIDGRLEPPQLFCAIEIAVRHSADLLAEVSPGPDSLELTSISLEQLLRAVATAFRPCLASGQHLDVQLRGPDIQLWAPRTELIAVVINLLKNAQEAISQHGRIVLRARHAVDAAAPPRRYIRLTVADDGHGLAALAVRQATERGWSTKAGAGRGQGLWRARLFAVKLGGGLQIRSAPGRGAAIGLTFPIAFDGRALHTSEAGS